MRGRASRTNLAAWAYLFGVMSCTLAFYILILNGQVGPLCNCRAETNKPKRHNDRIYVPNDLYNSRGLLNEGPGDNTDAIDDFDIMDECVDLFSRHHDTLPLDYNLELTKPEKSRDGIKTKLFINCGGTYPWSVELFLDTYPNAEEFWIHSFIKEKSYGVMYKHFANHSLNTLEASSNTSTVQQDVKCFGCENIITEKFSKLDIAEWILQNTKTTDYVIVRIESEEEREIVKRLVELKVFEHIDKYYTSSKDREFVKYVEKELSERSRFTVIQTWDTSKQTYSDFLTINPKGIPTKGKLVDKCQDTNAPEKFALFLYSVESSPNVFKVIDMMHQFSHNSLVLTSAFLPLNFFTINWGNNTFNKLFKTFHVGMYYSTESYNQNDSTVFQSVRELSLRNSAVTVQKVFEKHDSYMQHIMYSKEVDQETLKQAMEEYNFVFLAQGIDITHLTDHVLNDGTVTMDMTGWTEGRYLMINMDVKHSEFLVLYMLRRFAPWLIDVLQCSL